MLSVKHLLLTFQRAIQCSTGARAAAAASAASPSIKKSHSYENIVVIDAVRTPFLQSNGMFRELMSVDLQRHAILELLQRVKIPVEDIGHISCGTVVQECRTSNLAREAALTGGLPDFIPCSTVSLACISSSLSSFNVANMIEHGSCEAALAGGVELLSDYPIRYHKKVRSALIDLQKAKSVGQKVQLAGTIFKYIFSPDLPGVTEYTTNETMGASADRLAAAFAVSREEQDDFAIYSHSSAAKALDAGKLSDIAPVFVNTPTKKGLVSRDNGIRLSTKEKLAKLKPAFIKPYGTITAANASFLTDGASCALYTSTDYAKRLSLTPKAYIRQIKFVAQDPKDQLLLSPAYVIPQILDEAGLTIKDVDVFEIHEAFAGQVLANLKALDSDSFCKTYMKRSGKYGEIPLSKINAWGGSLSLGHPFGATGVRLVAHAANRLLDGGGRYAVIAACAAGGHGVGMLIEAFPQ